MRQYSLTAGWGWEGPSGSERAVQQGHTTQRHQYTHRRPQVVLNFVRDSGRAQAIHRSHVTEEHASKDRVPKDLPEGGGGGV